VYVGSIGKRMRQLAGEVGDGWATLFLEYPSMLKEHLKDVATGAGKSGRTLAEIDVMVAVYTAVTSDRERALDRVERRIRQTLIMERDFIKSQTGIEVPEKLSMHAAVLSDETSRRIRESAAAIPTELARKITEEVAAVGSVDDCIAKIEQFLDAGATSIVISDVSNDWDLVYRTYANDIIPYLKSEYG
jgi:alkanesulfonate monooxygenase SsuD/methylene tetrahydromethanopterin reductase-like flavin-dependent oxidoreductase (luciferase family)